MNIVVCHYEPRGDNGLEGFQLGRKYEVISVGKAFLLYSTEGTVTSPAGTYMGTAKGKKTLFKYFR